MSCGDPPATDPLVYFWVPSRVEEAGHLPVTVTGWVTRCHPREFVAFPQADVLALEFNLYAVYLATVAR